MAKKKRIFHIIMLPVLTSASSVQKSLVTSLCPPPPPSNFFLDLPLQIDYIFESEGAIPFCGRHRYTIPSKVKVDENELEKMKKQNEEKIKSVRAAF